MTESVEVLLYVAFIIAIAFDFVILIWHSKSNSFASRVAKILISAALLAIAVGLLILHCLTGESYVADLILVFMGLVRVVISSMID